MVGVFKGVMKWVVSVQLVSVIMAPVKLPIMSMVSGGCQWLLVLSCDATLL